MLQRDIILEQIEQLGRVLGKVVAEFLDLRAKGDISHAIEVTVQQLNTKLDLDLSQLIPLDTDALEELLKQRHFTDLQIDQLAELLYDMSCGLQSDDAAQALTYLNTAKRLIAVAERLSTTWTFGLETLKERVGDALISLYK